MQCPRCRVEVLALPSWDDDRTVLVDPTPEERGVVVTLSGFPFVEPPEPRQRRWVTSGVTYPLHRCRA